MRVVLLGNLDCETDPRRHESVLTMANNNVPVWFNFVGVARIATFELSARKKDERREFASSMLGFGNCYGQFMPIGIGGGRSPCGIRNVDNLGARTEIVNDTENQGG